MFDKLGDLLRESLDSGFIPENPKKSEKKIEEIEEKAQKIEKNQKIFGEKSLAEKQFQKQREFVAGFSKAENPQNQKVRRFDFRSFEGAFEKNREQTAQIYRARAIPQNVRDAFFALGIPENADADAAKKIYRERLQYYHPDKWIGTPYILQAQENTQKILDSWAILEEWFLNQTR